MKLTSYWQDTAVPGGDHRRTPVPERVDVPLGLVAAGHGRPTDEVVTAAPAC